MSDFWHPGAVLLKRFAFYCLLGSTACGGAVATGQGGQEAQAPGSVRPAWDPQDSAASQLPADGDCLTWLAQLGIAYRRLDALPGVSTPVEVVGPIAGITYVSAGKVSVIGDCRLILALDWAGRSLARVGVNTVRHSGAYVYRTTSSGRPSLHARGLALDVHAIKAGQSWYDVERDYVRGAGAVCQTLQPLMNHVYCRLGELRLFRELITPDHNYEHRDHIHMGVAFSG